MEDNKNMADNLDPVAEATSEAKAENCDEGTKCGSKKAKKAEAEIRGLSEELEATRKQLEAAQAELLAANDKYMRMLAEYDNFRRRSAKEKEGIYADAYEDAMKSVLPVLDNIERAAMYKDGEAVAKGLQMIFKSFSDALSQMGISEIECFKDGRGVEFDPELHNAVMHIEDENYGEGEIVEVLQKGYRKGDRILSSLPLP